MPNKNELTILVKLKDLASRGMRRLGLASDQTFRRMTNGLGKLSLKLTALAAGIAGATVMLVRFAGTRLKRIADELDFIGKTSKRLGVTVESLTDFQHVARLSGLEVKELAAGLGVFSRNLEDAREGVVKKRRAFETLGISIEQIRQGEIDLTELMVDVANGTKDLGSETEKTAALMEVFGRSGSKLGSIVKQDAEAIRAMAAEARHLQGFLGESGVKIFEDYNDSLERIRRAFRGLEIAVAVEILPGLSLAFNDWANDIADNRKKIVEDLLRMTIEGGRHLAKFGELFGLALTIITGKMKLLLIVVQSLIVIYDTASALLDKVAGSQEDAANSALKAIASSDQLKKTWTDLLESVKDPGKFGREVNKIIAPLEKVLQKIEAARKLPIVQGGEVVVTPGGADKPKQELGELQKLTGGLGKGLEELRENFGDTFEVARSTAISAGNAMQSSLQNQLEGIILGTTSVSDAFKEMGKQMLKILAQVLSKLIATRLSMLLLGGAFGASGGGGGEAAAPSGGAELAGFNGPGGAGPSALGGGNTEVNLTIVANDARGFDRLLVDRKKTVEDILVNALQTRRDVIVDLKGRG